MDVSGEVGGGGGGGGRPAVPEVPLDASVLDSTPLASFPSTPTCGRHRSNRVRCPCPSSAEAWNASDSPRGDLDAGHHIVIGQCRPRGPLTSAPHGATHASDPLFLDR